MNKYDVLSKRLKELLEKNNMSQRELAEKIGITEVTISRYISAQRVPKATEILKIADALNCSCDYLLGFQNELTKETEMETAIHNLKVFRTFLDDKWKNNIDIAIQALEKQIPKGILRGTVTRDMACYCPNCKEFVCFEDTKKHNYCPSCGQKLDW